jgi:hypothetical protein
MTRRGYPQGYDSSSSLISGQLDSPETNEFTTQKAENVRSIIGPNKSLYHVGDAAVSPRGAKHIIWSSEGYSYRGANVPALTATQKWHTGLASTNTSLATSSNGSPLPPTFTVPATLDFSPYRYLQLISVFTSIAGSSTPSLQFEIDFQDDTPTTPGKVAIWKPAALTAAVNSIVNIGPDLQYSLASTPADYTAPTALSGWTVYSIPTLVAPNGNIAWTTGGTVTGAVWTAWLYGMY